MKFQRKNIKLNLNAESCPAVSQAIMVPDGAAKIAIQFFHCLNNATTIPATIKLQQSTNGTHFDPVCDTSGKQVSITLLSGSTSASLSVLGILTLWLRFQMDIHESTSGSLLECNILFA